MKVFVRSLTVAAAIALLLPCLPASAQEATPAESEVRRLLSEIQKERSTVVALAKAKAVAQFGAYVPRSRFAEMMAGAAANARDPQVAFSLHQTAAWTLHEMHDVRYAPDGRTGPLAQQGCLRDWSVVGPFDNPSNAGYDEAFGPERGEVGPYAGRMTQIDWRAHPQWDRYCEFDLGNTVQPATSAVAFAATQLEADTSRDAVLLVGANGAYKAWLNGKLVAERSTDSGLFADNDAWKVKLRKGKNDLLIKLASTQDGTLGFVARLTDTKLRPLDTSRADARWERQPVATGTPKSDPRGVLARLTSAAEKAKGDDAVWIAMLWRSAEWQNVATPWRDLAERVLANPAGLTNRGRARVAHIFEEHWRQRALLEEAASGDFDPWISAALAAHLASSIAEPDRYRARRIYREINAKVPGFVNAQLELSDWYRGRGFGERALQLLEDFEIAGKMEIPAIVQRLADLHRRVGLNARADELDAQLEKINFLSGGGVWDDLRKAAMSRDWERALAVLDGYLEMLPRSTFAELQKAEILRASGRTDEALVLIDRLIAHVPGDADLYKAKAEILVAMKRAPQAIETLEAALEHRPQDEELKDRLALLKPEQNRFWEGWMIEDPWAIAKQTQPTNFNFDTLIENTVVHVAANGLATTVVQRVDRIQKQDGIESAKRHGASYQAGDEEVEILRVRVWKPDGTISEDFDHWDSADTRKGSTTYNDSATVSMEANDADVGDLVEFRYRISQVANENFRGDYFGDIAYLQGGRPIALQRWSAVYPSSWNLYFRAPKLEHERLENADFGGNPPEEGFRSTSFVMKSVPEVKTDRQQPGFTDVYDYLLVSNKQTYDEIGTWWWNLVKEQLIVDDEIRAKVNELIEGLTTADQKVQAIHNYVVKNTRYLHVGLGIHGWKPYRTTACFRNRYGDCKDKASLLKVMLEAAGVPANLVLVRTRRLGDVEDFPASMHIFNHAIAYVPSMDLYLDGTAEYNGTRELTSMDQGAQALIVEDGGKARFVRLPVDSSDRNKMMLTLEVDLGGEQPRATGKIVATGSNAVYLRQVLEDPERRAEALEKLIADDFPGAKLVTAKYANLDQLEKPTEIEFEFLGGQLLRADGQREFVFPLGRPKDLLDAYASQSKRHQDLTIRVPFSNETRMTYRIPAKKGVSKIPPDTKIETKFGGLVIDYHKDGGDLRVDVKYSIDVQRVSVEDYPEFRKFMSDVTTALNDTVGIGDKD